MASNHQSPIDRAGKQIAQAAESQKAAALRSLAGRRSLARILRLARDALARAERLAAQALKRVPPPQPVACRANCPWCCHIRLTASVPEVLLVLDHIARDFTDEDRQALRRKIANVDVFTRGRDGQARAAMRLPCPLLKDGSCSVHPVRPLSCRAVLSVDVEACRAAYDTRFETGVPQLDLPYLAANGVGYGLHAGLLEAGFGLAEVEMNAALAIGLQDPDAGRKWLAGEPVFEPAARLRS